MSVNPAVAFAPSTEVQVEPGEVRPAQAVSEHIPGSDSLPESDNSQSQSSQSIAAQDEVKVQMEPPGEIAVYQFVNQQGSVILQVPPQQWLNLALEISQESEKVAPKQSEPQGGDNHGH